MNVAYYMCAILLIYSLTAAAQDCRELLDSGDVHYRKFEDSKALEFYKKAMKLCPGTYEPLMKTTRAYNDVGEDVGGKASIGWFKTAMQYTDTMQKLYPDSLQSYFLKAAAAGNLALSSGGRTKVELARTVERNSKKAIAIDSSYAPAHVVLGVYYRQVATAGKFLRTMAHVFYGGIPAGTLKDSERELRKALALEPDNIFGHNELALTLYAMHGKKEAVAELEKVLALPDKDNESEKIKKQARANLRKWR